MTPISSLRPAAKGIDQSTSRKLINNNSRDKFPFIDKHCASLSLTPYFLLKQGANMCLEFLGENLLPDLGRILVRGDIELDRSTKRTQSSLGLPFPAAQIEALEEGPGRASCRQVISQPSNIKPIVHFISNKFKRVRPKATLTSKSHNRLVELNGRDFGILCSVAKQDFGVSGTKKALGIST